MNSIEVNAAESAEAFRQPVLSTRREAIQALEREMRRSDSRCGSKLLDAVMRFSDISEHLPPGVTEETLQFLCATASLKECLWEQLANRISVSLIF